MEGAGTALSSSLSSFCLIDELQVFPDVTLRYEYIKPGPRVWFLP